MTREEIKKAMSDTKKEVVLKNLHKLLSLVEGHPEYEDCISYAIEELEQETVSKEVYDHEYFLRKEFELKIDELQRQLEEQAVKIEIVRKAIDKYKAESEVQNADSN